MAHFDDTELVEALQLLAAPADQQVAAFPSWVVIADEVALTWDNAYRGFQLRDQADTAKWDQVREDLRSLDSKVGNPAPEHPAQWSVVALKTSVGWQDVRKAARAILARQGIPLRPPDSQRDNYVRIDT
jgi:hypothetical protein